MNPTWLTIKVLAQKGCSDRPDVVIGWIDHVLHHLGSLLGAIKLTILCTSVRRVGYLMLKLRNSIVQVRA